MNIPATVTAIRYGVSKKTGEPITNVTCLIEGRSIVEVPVFGAKLQYPDMAQVMLTVSFARKGFLNVADFRIATEQSPS